MQSEGQQVLSVDFFASEPIEVAKIQCLSGALQGGSLG